jgi:hypothetical protein
LAEIAAEIENIRTAWHWAVSQAYLAVLDQAVSSLFQFYELRCRFQEGEELFGAAISQLQQVDLLKANPAYEPILGKLQARQVALRIPIGLV